MEIEAAKVIGAGLAVIGVIGSGIGIGNIFSSFIEAVGRNPAARGEVFTMTMLGFANHGIKFFSFFYIPGVPFYMHPLLIPIEVISYLSRPISLSVRLFANMLAGHTLLKVFAGFVVAMPFFTGALPLAFIVALTGLEILIAFLQAYVFAILTCLYINDAYHLH